MKFKKIEVPFPIGVEYFRSGVPKREVWEKDFFEIKRRGFNIVRTASYWNWMEPSKGQYKLDDIDAFFDLAKDNGLYVWIDIMLATHGACPEWLIKEYPDICAVNNLGNIILPDAHPAYSQGAMRHCYDHPAWRKYGGKLLDHVVNRYKKHDAMYAWGIWDGINLSTAWTSQGNQLPCYCSNTIKKYINWLKNKFTLNELNERVLRRYNFWSDIEIPRSNQNVLEMLLYKEFNYENLSDHLKWMINRTRKLDNIHETRTHGGWIPRPWDEICAEVADSWGMSMPSNNLLNENATSLMSDRVFAFSWARYLGKNNRWWNEEIYSGMSPGGVKWGNQTKPEELSILLWMTLIYGASGAMFWQYRPDYMAFESPGYNLASLDGKPTQRLEAVSEDILKIKEIYEHLPLGFFNSQVAIMNHQLSHEIFTYNELGDEFIQEIRGLFRNFWSDGIQADIISPKTDLTNYKLILLPNISIITDDVFNSINDVLNSNKDTNLIATSNFGLYSDNGLSSYNPPDKFSEKLGVRISDFSTITQEDINIGNNVLETPLGNYKIVKPTRFTILEQTNGSEAVALLNGNIVGIENLNKNFSWYGFSFEALSNKKDFYNSLSNKNNIFQQISVNRENVIPIIRKSNKKGVLIFLFNLNEQDTICEVTLNIDIKSGVDLTKNETLYLSNNVFNVQMNKWGLNIIHCDYK